MSFDEELALHPASKRTLVRLRDEWPSVLRDRAHDPEPPALDWDRISSCASESSHDPAHNSENDTDYSDSD